MADAPSQTEEEKLASEWAAMAEAEPGAASAEGEPGADDQVGTPRVLNQNEIDSLLGFGEDGGAGGKDNSGTRAIIDSALVSYERLPMLEVVFDRLVRMMSTSLRNFTSDNVEVSIDNITSIRF